MPSRQTQSQSPSSNSRWDGDVQTLKYIGKGVSGLVFAIDSLRVAKISFGTPGSKEDIEIERKIYRKFAEIKRKSEDREWRYVLQCFEVENPRGLVLERCVRAVRSALREGQSVERRVRVRWMKQASKGLAFVHSCRVLQGDVGCHNMLLNAQGTLKLADFAGASLNGSNASINYEVRSRLPDLEQPTKISDIFALGSAFYEMATGRKPYAEIESHRTIQSLFVLKKFPDVEQLQGIGLIILKCWKQEYESAWDIARALDGIESEPEVEGEEEISLRRPVFTEFADARTSGSLQSGFSTLSLEHNRSATYVHASSRRHGGHQHESGAKEADGRRRIKGSHPRAAEHTSLSRFFFPWKHHQVQRGYGKAQYCH